MALILADFVYLQGRRARVGPKIALKCVPRAVWGILFADDACIVSWSSRGLELMMTTAVDVLGAFGLTVSERDRDHVRIDPAYVGNTDSLTTLWDKVPPDGMFYTVSAGAVQPPKRKQSETRCE